RRLCVSGKPGRKPARAIALARTRGRLREAAENAVHQHGVAAARREVWTRPFSHAVLVRPRAEAFGSASCPRSFSFSRLRFFFVFHLTASERGAPNIGISSPRTPSRLAEARRSRDITLLFANVASRSLAVQRAIVEAKFAPPIL